MILVLGIVSLLSGASLVFVYNYAQPQIIKNQAEELEEAIFKVLPGAVRYETIKDDGEEIYAGKDREAETVGYACIAKGPGYQGEISVIVGLEPGLKKVTGIEILESVETPGLGGKILEDGFRGQFVNLLTVPRIDLVKGSPAKANEVQAITGATISSAAVTNILNNKINKVKELLKHR